MNNEDLRTILGTIETGMSLSIPEAWVKRIIPGQGMKRDLRVFELAPEFFCNCKKENGFFVFEKTDPFLPASE